MNNRYITDRLRDARRSVLQFISATVLCASVFGATAVIPEPPDFLSEAQKKPVVEYTMALEASEEDFAKKVSEVNEKYVAALERTKAQMVKIGADRAATALTAEILRIRLGETRRSEELDSAPDNVRKMRGQYDQIIVRLNRLKHSRDAGSRFEVDQQLANVQTEFTKASDLDKAVALRDFREALGNPKKPEPVKEETSPPAPDPGNGGLLPPTLRRWPAQLEEERFVDSGEPQPMSAEQIAEHSDTLGPEPARTRTGYPVMLKSIASGQVSEIKPKNITGWGRVRALMFDGEPYWSATVTYPSTSMFGTFDTEGMALIRGDRVIHWLYPGSGEPIP